MLSHFVVYYGTPERHKIFATAEAALNFAKARRGAAFRVYVLDDLSTTETELES